MNFKIIATLTFKQIKLYMYFFPKIMCLLSIDNLLLETENELLINNFGGGVMSVVHVRRF